MESELMLPSPPPEFNFDSACSSPFLTAPSSPSFFFPKFENYQNTPSFDHQFEFDFSHKRCSVSDADDLFSEGQIKPLKPPPRVQFSTVGSSPRSPTKILIQALSPKKKDFDPFEEAIKQSQRDDKEGRERKSRPGSSPFRVSDILSESDPDSTKTKTEQNALFSFSKSVWKRYKKWKIKDLLFRNASEGRKDEIAHGFSKKNYKNFENEVKSSSFRSTESTGSGSGSSMRRKGSISAHEVHYEAHYMVNRAIQEEMKKKTSLPYKHGLMGLGCLGLEPPVNDLVRSFGSNRG